MRLEVELRSVSQVLDLTTLKQSSTLHLEILGEEISVAVSEDTMANIASKVIQRAHTIEEPPQVFEDTRAHSGAHETITYKPQETQDFSMELSGDVTGPYPSAPTEEPHENPSGFQELFGGPTETPRPRELPPVDMTDPRSPAVIEALKARARLISKPGRLPQDEAGNPIGATKRTPPQPQGVLRDDDFPQG